MSLFVHRALPLLALLSLVAVSACATTGEGRTMRAQDVLTDSVAVDQLLARSWRQMEAGLTEEACKGFRTVRAAEQESISAALGLGECALISGQLQEAMRAFERAKASEQFKAHAHQGGGLAMVRAGRFDEARSELSAAVEANDSLWRAWNGLGFLADMQQDWEASALAYASALEHTATPSVVHNNRGMSLLAQGAYQDAIRAFDLAIKNDSQFQAPVLNRRLALAMSKDYKNAAFALRQEERAQALNNAGYIAMIRGDYDDAERLFASALDESPSFYALAHENLQMLGQLRSTTSE